jgi:RNA polymerase primary sigma factor
MTKFESSKELSRYFKEIEGTSDPLTKEEEAHLIPLAKEGDAAAINRVINSCAKMVVKTSNKYMGQGVEVIDLVQEGNMGTIEALRRFKPGKARFSSYAQLWISKYINDSVATVGRLVRLPMNKEFEIFKLKKSGQEVEVQTKTSLDKKVSEDSNTTLGDLYHFTQPEINSQHDQDYVREIVDSFLAKIEKERDREILKAYYGIDRDCEVRGKSLSNEFGVSSAGIKKILNRIFESNS